ncbi:MAG: hypothetical protein IT424_16530 [Pirellulales bacterium]|nr:hypothetical protein [Pirellulales bacterium]
MSAYRYVVFPQYRQPTVDEARQLKELAPALANQFAWGTCRRDGRLAVAFDAGAFDHLRAIDLEFAALLRRWESRGCELVDHLAFVKDAEALRPVAAGQPAAHANDGRESAARARREQSLAAKHLAAKEVAGRSLLAVERTLERYRALERLGPTLLYLMMGAAAAATILAGLYVRGRLQASIEGGRQQAIERVIGEGAVDGGPSAGQGPAGPLRAAGRE